MRIIIFEDELHILEKTKILLQKACDNLGLSDIEITSGQKESSFAELVAVPSLASLYILDIESRTNKQAGIEFAKQIRLIDPDATIIFYSSHPNYIGLALKAKVGAYSFISKNEDEAVIVEKFQDAINHAWLNFKEVSNVDTLCFTSGELVGEVKVSDILFIESSDGDIILHLKNRPAVFVDKNLTQLEEELPTLFRAHRSNLVNPYNITEYDHRNRLAHFEGGLSCSVSKANEDKLIELIQGTKEDITYLEL